MWKAFLAQRTAIYFLVGYFVANFTYAALYWKLCPDGFYAPYTHYEQSWTNETHLVEPIVASMFSTWPMLKGGSENSEDNPLRNAKDFKVTNLRVVDVSNIAFDLSYTIQAPLWNIPPEQLPQGWSVGDITFMKDAVSLAASFQREPRGRFSSSEDNNCSKYISVTATMDNSLNSWKTSTRRACLTKEQATTIDDYIGEYNGISVNIGRSYSRMLYLSSVVITTLGLGDIVPLSDTARFLVGAEALTGIVLIGAFLNTIALKRSPQSPGDRQGCPSSTACGNA